MTWKCLVELSLVCFFLILKLQCHLVYHFACYHLIIGVQICGATLKCENVDVCRYEKSSGSGYFAVDCSLPSETILP